MRCSEEHAQWDEQCRILSGYGSLSSPAPVNSPRARSSRSLLSRDSGQQKRPLRGHEEGGDTRGEHAIYPSLSSRGIEVPPEFAPFPAAMRVGCQASLGRFPSATLDESERSLFSCWADCNQRTIWLSSAMYTYLLDLIHNVRWLQSSRSDRCAPKNSHLPPFDCISPHPRR